MFTPSIIPSSYGPSSGILKNTETSTQPSPSVENTKHLLASDETPVKTIDPLNNFGINPTASIHDYSHHYGFSNSNTSTERLELNYGSNDDEEMDETTTGTGSDTSSLKKAK